MDDYGDLGLQAYYTYSQLAKAMAISRRRVERLCKNEGIETERVGNRHVVWICDIEKHLPKMFKSLVTLQRARLMHRFFKSLEQEKVASEHAKAVAAEFERNERHITNEPT